METYLSLSQHWAFSFVLFCFVFPVQFRHSVLSNSVTPWAAHKTPLSITSSWSLCKLMSKSVILSNYLILYFPLLLLPSIFPPSIRGFSNESVLCIRWPKYWSFSIGPSNEYSGLISFRIDWDDLSHPRDYQESFPAPQFESIKSVAFSFLYSPTFTSIHDYGKKQWF